MDEVRLIDGRSVKICGVASKYPSCFKCYTVTLKDRTGADLIIKFCMIESGYECCHKEIWVLHELGEEL